MATRSAVRSSLVAVSVLLMTILNLSVQNNVQPVTPVAEIGSSSFTFNCTVNRTDLTANDTVWKHYSEELPQKWYKIVDATLIQLVIPNITESSRGIYECRSRLDNRHLIGGEILEVGYPPDQPTFERCLSDNLGPFTCWWNRGRDPILKTTYNLTYTFNDGSGLPYTCPDLEVLEDSSSLACHWGYTSAGLEHRFMLTAQNALGSQKTWPPTYVNPSHFGKSNEQKRSEKGPMIFTKRKYACILKSALEHQ
ncbi:cytokine receptor-like factor 1 isoform X1 [Branchiostoma floridae]|uniref:Cytokine receptor-like factor 1 isoform X1 n=1 Tax=Branchiostoma floridae TaxID=7739 RepID=A0A9J7LFD6_BRAFL|nr:cytokine receptor-like factor 1 isoform X1 [Branchiostoma floridae]